MRISEEQIEEIRSKADIVDFINIYVPLKKTGKNYKGLCPFHEEKTPSFVVSPDKQIFHCFGCGAGGNIFTFVKKYQNVSFLEAVKEVAKFVGIELKTETNVNAKFDKNEKFYELNNFAQTYFAKTLAESEHAKHVRDYLQKRDVKPRTQNIFGLGYAIQARNSLVKTLERNKFNLEDAKILGLIDKDKNGNYYDKYRGRLIFPIHTANGRIVGFGGRVLDPNAKTAKYINSPESPIYSKRKILYGLYFAKEEIQRLDKAIIVEGYMDVISLYQNGIKNVVAASGTSLTSEQATLLSRYTRNVVAIFDADSAGERAALRSIEVLLKANFNVKLLNLPQGEDPDSYIKSHTSDDFRELVNSAKDFLTFQAAQFEKQGMFDDPVQRTNAIRELIRSVALVNDKLARISYLSLLAKNFNLNEKILEEELENFLQKENSRKEYADKKRRPAKITPAQNGNYDKTAFAFEKNIIKLLFSGNMEVVGEIFDHIHIDAIANESFREIVSVIYDAYMEDVIEPSLLFERLDENLRQIAAELVINKEPISEKWGINDEEQTTEGLLQLTRDLITKYQLHAIEKQIEELSLQLSSELTAEEQAEILAELNELLNEKKALSKKQREP